MSGKPKRRKHAPFQRHLDRHDALRRRESKAAGEAGLTWQEKAARRSAQWGAFGIPD